MGTDNTVVIGGPLPPVVTNAEGAPAMSAPCMTSETMTYPGPAGYADFAKYLDPRKLVPGGRVYVVVLRTADLPNGQKICMTSGNIAVQLGHAIAKLTEGSNWHVSESDIALLSVASSKDLEQLALDLTNEGTAYVKYLDEGKLYGEGVKVFTALATHPIQKNASAALKVLRPWNCACNVGSSEARKERLGLVNRRSEYGGPES